MRFSVYLPPQVEKAKRPVLYWLSGLTCTEENVMAKAGIQRVAARFGLVIVAPDTSPRQTRYSGDADSWDFGLGAGFYVDATKEPWSKSYRMFSYVTEELPRLAQEKFPIAPGKESIFGHSMGGHGALVAALRQPGRYASVSAFSPIVAPTKCPWGKKAFRGYLGEDESQWQEYDACWLVRSRKNRQELFVDQGEEDKFLRDQLMPSELEAACADTGQRLILRRQPGYDHSYYFISTFLEDHVAYHAEKLGVTSA